MILYPVTLLIEPKLPTNLLKFDFEEQGWVALSGLVFLYLLMFDFFFTGFIGRSTIGRSCGAFTDFIIPIATFR